VHAVSAPQRVVRAGLLAVLLVVGSASIGWSLGDEGADGRFERRDSFHFKLYQDVDLDERGGLRGSRRFEQEVLRHLERAYDRLDALLDLRPERKLVVYVWDPSLFDREYSGLFRFPAAGFYGGAIHIRGDTAISSRLVSVLHHELVHAAFDAEAPRLLLPAWMNEGLAEWFEARALGQRTLTSGQRLALIEAARQGALFSLASLSGPSFGGLGPDAAALAYLQSHAFIDYLADEYGERSLVDFWSAVVRSSNLERGARRAFRNDLADLETGFRRSLGAL
jgi:hypothetical protein